MIVPIFTIVFSIIQLDIQLDHVSCNSKQWNILHLMEI